MEFILNGEKHTYHGDGERGLLSYLRDDLGITGTKDGCNGQGSCGCCMIQQNDRAVLACLLPMKKVAGTRITTVEGLEPSWREDIGNAFAAKGGIQCGFCIPGFVMSANVLLEKEATPSRDQIVKAVNRNLCRCTGYAKIIDAVETLADHKSRGLRVEKPKGSGKVGTPQAKYEAVETTIGSRPFVADMKLDGMLYGALVFSEHPRALVKSIDTTRAAEQAIAVFTANDIPGDRHIGLIVNDWPLMIAPGEETRYVGDILAGVVAESEAAARAAAALVAVDYEVREPVTDPFKALEDDSPRVHEQGNLLAVSRVQRGGDVDAALAASAHVVRRRYQTQRIEHAFMEPECAVAVPGENGAGPLVYSQGQGAYEDRKQVARLLGLAEDQVRIIQVQNGGAFGGKEDLSVQGHAALFAHKLGKPVRVNMTREESLLFHPKRHPITLDYALGCDASGKLTVVKADIVGDTGAYASVGMKVLERAVGHATGAYTVPTADVRGRTVYTNNIPCGAMRGFGANQATFAVECAVDELCELGGFDRWQFRYDNAIDNGDRTATGQIIQGGAGVKATLEAVKDAFYAADYAGLACGIKNTGIGNGMADDGTCRIDIVSADKVVVHHGWTEMGQGVHTMAVQMLCEETGLDPEIVEVCIDTQAETPCGMTTASRATAIVGNAVIDACRKLNADLETQSLAQLAGKSYRGKWICDWTTKPGKDDSNPVTHFAYSYATQLVVLNEKGKISKVVAAHDAGKVINPMLFEGQIEGSVHMGLGYAITEDFPMEGGHPVSTLLSKCGVLRARRTPPIEVIGVEVPDPHGPYGAKGVGEIGLVPTAGAVANALYQFDKQRRTQLPLKVRHLV
ncbi:MAG: selenium-dependent xanthine dehydrogenase [Acidobacteriota bacterium]|nr:selenium-dependent xanthine dehydrogenase [Acidobacteriota bacterium]